MKRGLFLIVMVAIVLGASYFIKRPVSHPLANDMSPVAEPDARPPVPNAGPPRKAVLDISVHTIDELRIVLDRAEQLAERPEPQAEEASVVLVLHGPEVEFFSRRNYGKYKEIVDQAERLDAFDVVDVKICQTMLGVKGVAREDIPAFVDQVPFGPDEVDRLVRQGYVYF